MITCNNCRNKLADTSLFCNMCGIKIKNTCKNCGNELPDGSLFCNMCGNKKSNYEEKTTQTILTNSQNKNNIFLLVFGLMLLVVVISSIVFTVSENKSQEEVTSKVNQVPEEAPYVYIPRIPLTADLPNGYLSAKDRYAYFIRWKVEGNQINGQLEYSARDYKMTPMNPNNITQITYFKGTIDEDRITFDLQLTYNDSRITSYSNQIWKGRIDDFNHLYIDQIDDKKINLWVFRPSPVEEYHNAINILLTDAYKKL